MIVHADKLKEKKTQNKMIYSILKKEINKETVKMMQL